MPAPTRTRFAPSPTGDLHLGSAFTALASWWLARSQGGATVLRVEDLDRPRVVPGAEDRQREDLAWLGLDWDEEPAPRGDERAGGSGSYRQSERLPLYEGALLDLTSQGRTYPCDCSRAEIARVASAPHEGEEVTYPGTCRDKDPARPFRRAPAIRLRVEALDLTPWSDGVAELVDPGLGHAGTGGDFVLRRGDGVHAYQLAVSVDDLAMAISDVVRGDDLLASTPRQLLLMQLWQRHGRLAWAEDRARPKYWHLPLVRAADGSRLAKRTPAATVRELRASGVEAPTLVGELAYRAGILREARAMTPRELAVNGDATCGLVGSQRGGWTLPTAWART